ncbi:menaquinone-dependent protoporphyrinogen oxidase [Labrenzia sp. EL_195]|nr:menaquinone-dependent protoporphyrinogen oxidase [Labrenzia sp. EL_195]
MRYLIAYATTEGQTEKISKFIGATLSGEGHEVRFHNVSDLSGGLSIPDFDKTIIAGSVHSARHQPDLELFVFANRGSLNELPGLFVSVSLAAAFQDTREEAKEYVDAFLQAASWKPTEIALIAGAVKPGSYDWFEKSALLEGDLADHVNKELQNTREFTDWDALSRLVSDFAKA